MWSIMITTYPAWLDVAEVFKRHDICSKHDNFSKPLVTEWT